MCLMLTSQQGGQWLVYTVLPIKVNLMWHHIHLLPSVIITHTLSSSCTSLSFSLSPKLNLAVSVSKTQLIIISHLPQSFSLSLTANGVHCPEISPCALPFSLHHLTAACNSALATHITAFYYLFQYAFITRIFILKTFQ